MGRSLNWLCASDRAGLRPPCPLPPPAPSLYEALTAKLHVVAEFTRELSAQPRGVFTGYAMLATAPSSRGAFARQKLWTYQQRNQVMAQCALLGFASCRPFFYSSQSVAG